MQRQELGLGGREFMCASDGLPFFPQVFFFLFGRSFFFVFACKLLEWELTGNCEICNRCVGVRLCECSNVIHNQAAGDY